MIYLLSWFVISIPVGMFVGKFCQVGGLGDE